LASKRNPPLFDWLFRYAVPARPAVDIWECRRLSPYNIDEFLHDFETVEYDGADEWYRDWQRRRRALIELGWEDLGEFPVLGVGGAIEVKSGAKHAKKR